MTVITKVQFSHPDMALADTIRSEVSATVRIVPEAGTDPEHDASFILVEGDVGDEFEAVLSADHTVESAYLASEHEGQLVFGLQFAPVTKLLAPRVTAGGGLVLDSRTGEDGWVERWQLPDRNALHDVWQSARDDEFSFDILELHRMESGAFGSSFGLTAEQREAILHAHAAGYFEEPRAASLDEVAEGLQISKTAASGRLRRGIDTLVANTLVEDE